MRTGSYTLVSQHTSADRRSMQQALFDELGAPAPEGWRLEEDFLSIDQEAELLQLIRELPLAPMQYKDFVARRRGISFGGHYDFDANRLLPSPALPAGLAPLRAQAAAWFGVAPDDFVHALVAEYAPGTPLGWHRDVPDFADVVGISLLGVGRMQFRRYPPRPLRSDPLGGRLTVEVAPRSIYVMRGAARWDWQHRVEPTESLRYSITFRTANQARLAPARR
ncbi:conserved hypothetical protein [Burkholderiales bacterium 8X]|nr:conserved hypothetical protein [Burkholderiales bacterium 8X]